MGAIAVYPLRVPLHPLALRFASSVLQVLQRVQSKALEGAMRPAEGAIAPSAPVWLRACIETIVHDTKHCYLPSNAFRLPPCTSLFEMSDPALNIQDSLCMYDVGLGGDLPENRGNNYVLTLPVKCARFFIRKLFRIALFVHYTKTASFIHISY